jgi:branched-chain amino acid aminotransferase
VILGEIEAPGITVGEKVLMPADLEEADEVFITSTTRDLLPVMQIEEKKVGRADSARHALAGMFAEYLRAYVLSHKGSAAVVSPR